MPLPAPSSEPAAWLTLCLARGVSQAMVRNLLGRFGSPDAVLAQSAGGLRSVVSAREADALRDERDSDRVRATLSWLASPENHLVTLADDDYPRALLEIADPPPVLYVKGRRELLGAHGLAIVGSRNATPQGIKNAEAFAEALSAAGLAIVSGMALGIDAAAHAGGLRGRGSSIAVVGTGLDVVYPARNRELAHALAAKGAIVSEFALGTPGVAANFPRRNRIISGLSKGCLVVEAAIASGSLITARLAGEQGRDVFAIPGSIHSPLSKGCHLLIKQGAKLVDAAEDILEELGMGRAEAMSNPSAQSASENPLLAHLGHDPVSLDELMRRTGLEAPALSASLMELEIEGRVTTLPGGKFQRLA
ncbi:MAG: DNA-protecting protein DprA [Betaproteobacteria bacterium]|nr:DNA-protecting protein DprA [Betaproteobacteria bacterium]